MLQMMYASRATVPFDSNALRRLLDKSRAANAVDGVTGLLVYEDDHFLQVLEGPPAGVLRTYRRIEQDPRHADVFLLWRGMVDGRTFPDWRMGFFDAPTARAKVEGFSSVMMPGFSWGRQPQDIERAHRIVDQFRDGRWRRQVAA